MRRLSKRPAVGDLVVLASAEGPVIAQVVESPALSPSGQILDTRVRIANLDGSSVIPNLSMHLAALWRYLYYVEEGT